MSPRKLKHVETSEVLAANENAENEAWERQDEAAATTPVEDASPQMVKVEKKLAKLHGVTMENNDFWNKLSWCKKTTTKKWKKFRKSWRRRRSRWRGGKNSEEVQMKRITKNGAVGARK